MRATPPSYWTRYGTFAAGMAAHTIQTRGSFPSLPHWAQGDPGCFMTRFGGLSFEEKERRYPDNLFIQNGREADTLITLHSLGLAMPVHDRPEPFVRLSGACGRPDGGLTHPHALYAMKAAA